MGRLSWPTARVAGTVRCAQRAGSRPWARTGAFWLLPRVPPYPVFCSCETTRAAPTPSEPPTLVASAWLLLAPAHGHTYRSLTVTALAATLALLAAGRPAGQPEDGTALGPPLAAGPERPAQELEHEHIERVATQGRVRVRVRVRVRALTLTLTLTLTPNPNPNPNPN